MNNREKRQLAYKCTVIGAFFDFILGGAKVIIGYFFNSHALITDGIHSFSDLFTDGFVLIISKISTEGPDENHPYGHGKFETIGSVGIGILIFLVGVLLAIDNVYLIINPPKEILKPGTITLIIAALSVILKEAIFQYTKRVAKKIDSQILLANAWHSRTDALSSIIVFIGLLLSILGLPMADFFVSIIVAFFIGKVGIDFIFNGVSELVDTSIAKEKIQFFEKEILKNPSVLDVHNFRSRMISNQMFFDVNIVVNSFVSVSEGHEVANWVVHRLKELDDKVMDVTVHIDVEHDHPTDDKGQMLALLPLPLKQELEDILKTKLGEDLYDCIHKFNAHYIHRKITLDIYFQKEQTQKKQEIAEALSKVSIIEEVRFYKILT